MEYGSLQDWLEFDVNNPNISLPLRLPDLHPCVHQNKSINCSYICLNQQSNDIGFTQSLWNPSTPSNLVTCALYWTFSFQIFNYEGTLNNVTPEALEAFNAVGLDLEASVLSSAKIPFLDCFGNVESIVSGGAISGPECDPNILFPRFNGFPWSSGGPLQCLMQLCSPSGILDPDIGGTGIFASLIMQSSIAVLAFVVITVLDWWSSPGSTRQGSQNNKHRKHFEAWVTALVDFHKAQCFFSSAIQIAALVFYVSTDFQPPLYQPKMSTNSCFTTATSSSVPVVLTLIAIHHYGRPSWYLILLSVCCFSLSVTVLVLAYYGILNQHLGDEDRNPDNVMCGGYTATDLLKAWCPPKSPTPVMADAGELYTGWNWVLWANCLIWLLLCIVDKTATLDPISTGKVGKALRRAAGKISFWRTTSKFWLLVYKALFLVAWIPCVGYQLFTYILYYQYHYVSTEWGFGQIIALTVWVPTLAELLHLERSNRNDRRLKVQITKRACSNARSPITAYTRRGQRQRLHKQYHPATLTDSAEIIHHRKTCAKDALFRHETALQTGRHSQRLGRPK